MLYSKRSKHGDAGEYLVAYSFTKMFGWPCRLFGVDIGVDAETEILDANEHSTGDVIKIQIKTFSSFKSDDAQNVYTDPEHIAYWKRFCVPIIVCCVDLEGERIYWRHVTATEAFDSDGNAKRIVFNLQTDLLEPAARGQLKELVCPEESKQLEERFAEMRAALALLPNSSHGFLDLESIARAEDQCAAIRYLFVTIESIIAYFPWRISSVGLEELKHAKRRVQIVINDCAHSRNDLVEGA